MGFCIYEFLNPKAGIRLNPCLSSASVNRGVEAMHLGNDPNRAKTAFILHDSNVYNKMQSGYGKRPTSRGERRQQSSNFNLSTGMTYMQYKVIKRKRPIWPWILLSLVLVALLSRVFPDNAIPASAPSPSLQIAAAPTTVSQVTMATTTSINITPSPVRYLTPSPSPSPAATPVTVLGKGMRGNNVKALQEKLIDLGYLKEGQADGVYGRGTEKAVEAFQGKNGLYSDGVAGEKTLTLLYSGNAKKKD